ncbi:protein DEK-like isoform X2 [Oncorhynchus keta]|nr:protein DEK-like isoform X2 [Oncorhynchus keta]XP_035607023.1 protein DEK-like isoform X2 [Oncorhynchus keta]XP_035607024.1 protein DEK-like isoform X2 [Oncorhynchus keta]XP_035607025.1 protein DEK-like isoform X2 [Oncorhynchus keta]
MLKCTDMTETMDEKMEVCPLSDEMEKEQKVEDLADSPYKAQKPRNEMSRDITLSQIVEGKREKKTVQRLDFQVAKPAKVLKVENGGGDKLGDIARVNHHLGKLKVPDLKPLHTILFDMPGKIATMRKNMRLFNGFPFEVDSDPYIKKKERMMRITCVRLRTICKVLDLEKGGNQSVLIDRIMTFLISPRISGKPVISKRKKKSKKNISTKDSKSKTKAKARSTSSSPRKVKAESKSKAIVTDSSSDEDEDDEQGVTVEQDESDAEKKSGKSGKREKVTTDEDTDDSEDYEDPKSNPPAKGKRTPSRKCAQPAKKAAPAKKKTKVEDSDLSESDSDKDEDEEDCESEVEKPKKKPAAKSAALAKPAAKTKKADSSSNKQKNNASKGNALDSSDDDEPLIKMIKKPPTDEQLKETVKTLLKDANLEEMTMKKICQKVYDTYPDYDLTSRKDYVKQTVKTLIS